MPRSRSIQQQSREDTRPYPPPSEHRRSTRLLEKPEREEQRKREAKHEERWVSLKQKWPDNAHLNNAHLLHLFMDVDENGKPKPKTVPNSCIQSAEYIIQSMYHKQRLQYPYGSNTRKPHVVAHFGKEEVGTQKSKNEVADGLKKLQKERIKVTDDGITIDITDHPKLQNVGQQLHNLGIGLTDYEFKELPKPGQGLMLLNKTDENQKPFNMHLGAVVARKTSKAIISNMSEERKRTAAMETMKTLTIKVGPKSVNDSVTVEGFRGHDYSDVEIFALGKLEAEADESTQSESGEGGESAQSSE
jgi:hypothetical protein